MSGLPIYITVFMVSGVYIFFLWIAAASAREIGTTDDYFITGRKLRTGKYFATLYAAEMSIATVFIAFFDLASSLGLQLMAAVLTFSLGQYVLGRVAPRIKRVNKSRLTLPGVIGERYNSRVLTRISLATIAIGFGGLFATEIMVGAQLVRPILDKDSYFAFVFLLCVLVTFYTVLGGFRNVIRTDIFQVGFIVVGIVAITYSALCAASAQEGIRALAENKGIIPSFALLMNLVVINVAYPMVDLAAWQRIAAASDKNVAQRGSSLGAGAFFACWIFILISAIILVNTTGKIGADAILSSLFMHAGRSLFDSLIAGLGLGSLLSALLSAGDVFLITASQAICMDETMKDYYSVAEDNIIRDVDIHALTHARRVTFSVAFFSIIVVGTLIAIGARVSDLIFVLYGSTTALLPTVAFVLLFPDRDLSRFASAAISSSIVGIGSGWAYGITALIGNNKFKDFFSYLDPVPGPMGTYNAACVALSWSVVTFLLVLLIGRLKTITTEEH